MTNLGVVEQEFYVLGTPHTGPFYKINEKISEVEKWASQNSLPCTKTFGYFIDSPKMDDESRLRSEGGCISLTYKYEDLAQVPPRFFKKKFLKRKYLLLRFSGSPAISPFKVYPKAEEWFQQTQFERGKTTLEVYEIFGNRITTDYYFPISTQ